MRRSEPVMVSRLQSLPPLRWVAKQQMVEPVRKALRKFDAFAASHFVALVALER